jgi:outer membrane protein assembly factor BamB
LLTADDVKGHYGGHRNGEGDGPRGTPTIDSDRVYVEGGLGDLACLEAATGKTIWHTNLSRDFGGGKPGWGYSESPLVEGNMLIVTPGGKGGTVLALDKYTGEKIWQSSGISEGAHYSSPIAADIHGVRSIVQFASKNVFGVAAKDGAFLWSYSAANNGTANVATPIVADNHVFASSGYGTGGGLAKIVADGDAQKAEEVYFDKQMANHHGGIVKVGDHMYGFGNAGLMCLDFKTGELKWKARSAGKGSLCYADGMLYLLGEGHQVALAEATPDEYREHGSFKLEGHGRPSWAHPVVAGGVFYIRDQETLTAYDVKK